MQSNSGSLAGAASGVAEQKEETKKTFKTLPFEVATVFSIIVICVVLLIQWNKIPTNITDIETAYIGPESEQIIGAKIVRDYDRNSPYHWEHVKDSTGQNWWGIATKRNYIAIKDPALNKYGEDILNQLSVDKPGVHVGMMTHMVSPSTQSLTGALPQGYKQMGRIDHDEIKKILWAKDSLNQLIADNICLVTKSLVRTIPSETYAKIARGNNQTFKNPYKHLSRRSDLRRFHEYVVSIKMEKIDLEVTSMNQPDTAYTITNGKIKRSIVLKPHMTPIFKNNIKEEPLLSLFGYSPQRKTAPAISQKTLSRLFYTEQQCKEMDQIGLDWYNQIEKKLPKLQDKFDSFSKRVQHHTKHSNAISILDIANDTAALMQSLINALNSAQTNKDLLKEGERLQKEMMLLEKDTALQNLKEKLVAYSAINVTGYNMTCCFGKLPHTEEPGKAMNVYMASTIGQTHQFGGYSYCTSDFTKPHRIWTLNDLSRTNEFLRICPTETDVNNKPDLMKLEYDFRTAVDGIACSIEPDEYTGTGIIYTDPDKLADIVSDGLRISAHFPEWDNTQTKRFFILTLIITIAVSFLFRRVYTQWFVEHCLNNKIEARGNATIAWKLGALVIVFSTIVCIILCW